MTKLEELKAAADYAAAEDAAAAAARDAAEAAAWDADAAARDAADAKCAARHVAGTAYEAAADAWGKYQEELEKQQTTPREPVEDEGNPLV